MNKPLVEEALARFEREIRDEFPDVRLEFARQDFTNHIELWVYVFNPQAYEPIKDRCEALAANQGFEQMDPEVWLLVKTWTGRWPGGESEQELQRRRDDFRRRHNMPVPGAR